MTAPDADRASRTRHRSNARLLLFLGAVVLIPVVLVAGPFRDRFFPHAARSVAELAQPPPPRFGAADRAALLEPEQVALLGRDFEHACDRSDWTAVALALERVPPARATPAVRYLHGLALLQARHPATALAGLQDAVALAAPPLEDDARYALAQALLMLARGDAARGELSTLAAGASEHAAAARRQLEQLAALR